MKELSASPHLHPRVPNDHELPARLRAALAVLYLVYNAGLTDAAEPGRSRCPQAIRMTRILASLMRGRARGG